MYTAWFPRVFAYFYLRIHYLQFQPTHEFIFAFTLVSIAKAAFTILRFITFHKVKINWYNFMTRVNGVKLFIFKTLYDDQFTLFTLNYPVILSHRRSATVSFET